ncbi:hypothetical protein TanjilG_18573 [Lupinus angustifolius]|uniref:MI domain-containing protein n=1 Tax=Lupinus angustifolius TaxID=3871 RepID=A0A394DBM5_LUPAN|nr:hypothetical protein TanjilG_18573 [Lupinus angustifolius]
MASLSKDSKGVEVLKKDENNYLSAPLHVEIIERRWVGSKNMTVDDVKIVKRALIMAMKRRQVEGPLLDLLKEAAEDGFINSSQMSKGFSRLIDTVDDLTLDIPNACEVPQQLISKASFKG